MQARHAARQPDGGPRIRGVVAGRPCAGNDPASPLQTLLGIFGAAKPATWPAFDNLPGVHWRDAKPLGNPDSHSSETTHTRSGSTLLTGFGDVDVPDGKVGEEAGIKTDNEGHVGVVLNGNATTVLSIALRKFYPSDDTQDILLRQLGRRATVKRIAGRCALDYGTTAPNTQNNVFFRVTIASAAVPVFAETYVDEEGGNQGRGDELRVLPHPAGPTYREHEVQGRRRVSKRARASGHSHEPCMPAPAWRRKGG